MSEPDFKPVALRAVDAWVDPDEALVESVSDELESAYRRGVEAGAAQEQKRCMGVIDAYTSMVTSKGAWVASPFEVLRAIDDDTVPKSDIPAAVDAGTPGDECKTCKGRGYLGHYGENDINCPMCSPAGVPRSAIRIPGRARDRRRRQAMSDPKDWETDPELTIARLRAELAAAERERDEAKAEAARLRKTSVAEALKDSAEFVEAVRKLGVKP